VTTTSMSPGSSTNSMAVSIAGVRKMAQSGAPTCRRSWLKCSVATVRLMSTDATARAPIRRGAPVTRTSSSVLRVAISAAQTTASAPCGPQPTACIRHMGRDHGCQSSSMQDAHFRVAPSSHGRALNQTWMDEDRIAEVLKSERMGHEVPGMRGVYSHVTRGMRDELKAALQQRWTVSVRQRAALSPRSSIKVLDALLGDLGARSAPKLLPKPIAQRRRSAARSSR
jgi:hypothetical protein